LISFSKALINLLDDGLVMDEKVTATLPSLSIIIL
jgi:hypothetical protein